MTNKDAFEEGDDSFVDAEIGKPMWGGSLSIRPRILLAEDEPDHQLVVSAMLRKVGADVITVENGQSAVDRALQAQEKGKPFGCNRRRALPRIAQATHING
jgi:PleD family two-component response regulator